MKRLLGALSASVLLALVPLSASAITFGEVDTDNRYPFVGMLAFYEADGDYSHRCSGTLMTPTVVATASHCTVGMFSARAYFEVEVTDDFRNDPEKGVIGTPVTHPQFNPNNLDNDVAVVLLGKAVRLDEYPVLTAEGFLSELKVQARSMTTRSSPWDTGASLDRSQGASRSICSGGSSRPSTRASHSSSSTWTRTPRPAGAGRAAVTRVVPTSGRTH